MGKYDDQAIRGEFEKYDFHQDLYHHHSCSKFNATDSNVKPRF